MNGSPAQRYNWNPHPQRVNGCCGSCVGKAIKADVDFIENIQPGGCIGDEAQLLCFDSMASKGIANILCNACMFQL